MTNDKLRAEAGDCLSEIIRLRMRDCGWAEALDCLVAFAKRHGKLERLRGMENAANIADLWATSQSCAEHSENPCCHVRTGAGIAEKIRANLAALEKGEEVGP